MTNIVVRLSCGPECDQNSILLNAHYDTTLGSPGAADDALGVGVLMELIRVLSLWPALKKNSVVFLFNGGEESLQDASHSFITNHELKDHIKAVINLEGCGTTGPEILFQTNSRPMIDAYKKVPYPHGTVLANDMFATGLILSDRDFRQFVEYGNLTGLDMAVYTNSYLYHTHLDLNEHLEQGLPQHMGENTLVLVTYLGNEADLTGRFEQTSDVIFFDVLGLFFVMYSLATAIKVHVIIGAFALLVVSVGASRPSFKSVLSIAVSFIAALVTPSIAAAVLLAIGYPMQWFTHEWLPLIVFGPSSAAGMLLVQYLVHDDSPSADESELSSLSGAQCFFSVALGCTTYAGLASSYIVAVYSFSLSIALFYNQRKVHASVTANQKISVDAVDFSTYLIASVVPSTYFLQCAYSLFDIFVTLTGRIGVEAPVDYLVSAIKIVLGLLVFQGIILLWSMAFLKPFDRMHPKRIFAQHLRNTTVGTTQIFLANADPGPVLDYVSEVEALFDAKATFKSGAENPGDWNAVYPFSQFLDSYVLDSTPYIRSRTENKTVASSTEPLTNLIKDAAPKLIVC
ncbi:hypothetical protein BGX28_009111 [Mortierella sp. GBA30]|nr:hypothetical protein BGX28_009111 [Mortierella sp. GBA30]